MTRRALRLQITRIGPQTICCDHSPVTHPSLAVFTFLVSTKTSALIQFLARDVRIELEPAGLIEEFIHPTNNLGPLLPHMGLGRFFEQLGNLLAQRESSRHSSLLNGPHELIGKLQCHRGHVPPISHKWIRLAPHDDCTPNRDGWGYRHVKFVVRRRTYSSVTHPSLAVFTFLMYL